MKNMRALFRQVQPEEVQMERRILIGTAVVLVVGLIWSAAAMGGWVPVTY
jgi:hypothetical protein